MTSGVASSRDSLLRMAIHLDATGTGVLGLGTAAFARPLAELTALTPAQTYVAAAAFILYGVVGNLLARRPRIRGIGIGLSAFNFFGTVAAVATVAAGALHLTGAGQAIVLGCGIYTLAFGAMQLVGVRRLL
ncbi:MAG: hypothetical protein KDB72_19790 [Mycobacterium sp.]|nr:hypothetical protein [Mycobacterium sp.]